MVSTSSSDAPRGKKHRVRLQVKDLAAGAVLLGALSVAPNTRAQGKVITISEVTIVGRIQKPIAAVDVSRIQPKMTLGELRQPFLDRIEEAIYHAPF